MQELPPADRVVITMQELEGRSVKEIAAAMGVSSIAVRVRAMRARAKLKRALEKLLENMNDEKLKRLFASARKNAAPAPGGNFASGVLRAIRSEPPPGTAEAFSLWEHLNSLFPRVAVAAAALIVLSVAADWGLTAAGLPGLNEGAAQVTSQYFFNSEDL